MEALVSAFIAAAISLFTMYITFRRSLDEASGWRQKLFDAASSKCITMGEVYLLRASIRYEPSPNVEEYTFGWICNVMIYYCDYLSLKYANTNTNTNTNSELNFQEQEIIRIFIRCLLKHHWEHYASMISLLKWHHRSQKPDFIKNSYNKAVKVCHTLKDEAEANLLSSINDKMMGGNTMTNTSNTNESNQEEYSFQKDFLAKYVETFVDSSSIKDDKSCLRISNLTIIVMILIIVVNFLANLPISFPYISDFVIGRQTNAFALLMVLLLIARDSFSNNHK